MLKQSKNSEFPSYRFILNDLQNLGWNIKNPTRDVNGEVYTQNECLADKRIANQIDNTRPENVIKIDEKTFYIIEAKPERTDIGTAVDEAQNFYAEKVNRSREIKAVIISGVAGNESDGYLVKSKYLERSGWKIIKINGQELTGLVSPELAKQLLITDKAVVDEILIPEEQYLATAETINGILHQGAINKDYRARVMAALLLALIEETPLNLNESPNILVNSINARADAILQREGKPEFYQFIAIDLPSSPENHFKFKKALVQTIQELLRLNIRSAMKSGTDILGKFYEVFLKYGNGAKEIGIVLTPRHITKFACEALDIQINDIVYDPTCGTGGFLVSAFDYVKSKCSDDQIDKFKQNNIFGVEQQDGIIALAIVNMIFRGDGKSNIEEGDCLKKWLNLKRENNIVTAEYIDNNSVNRIAPVSKILMNPPFALKTNDEKEFKFIEQALQQMRNEGLLFSILPSSGMVKQGKYLNWRRESLLRKNSLIAVITFPKDLFYPIGVETCAIIVKKGIPHPERQKVLWVKIKHDGFLKSKGKRLPSNRINNNLKEFTELIKSFTKNQDIVVKNEPEQIKVMAIDFSDRNLELLPEVYLDEEKPTHDELLVEIDQTLKDAISFMIKFNKTEDFVNEILKKELNFFKANKPTRQVMFKEVPITDLFQTPIKTGAYHVSSILDEGTIPLISCVSDNGGIEGFFKIEPDKLLKNMITIACDGMPLTSFYHYYDFVVKDNVLICNPTKKYRHTTLLFFTNQINSLRWRFSYGRKCYENKVHKIKIFVPLTDKREIDEDYIDSLFKSTETWNILERIYDKQ